MPFIAIAHTSEVTEGACLQRQVGDFRLLITRAGDQFRVIDNVCPHRGALLGQGPLRDNQTVECPWHGWVFDVETGEGLTNPMSQLRRFECRVEGDELHVDLDL